MKKFLIPMLFLVLAAASVQANAMTQATYLDKVYGEWLGKCIGGALGMPIEGWNYRDIEAKFPVINGYTGYFDTNWTGWSGMLTTVSVPNDGQWHKLQAEFTVPNYDPKASFPVPIIGMSYETSTAPGSWEMRNLRIARPDNQPAFEQIACTVDANVSWAAADTARFNFEGVRAWLKMKPIDAEKASLKPGETVVYTFNARHISGDSKIGFALDYYSTPNRKGFGPDDDTSYQIVGLHTLETYGPDLSAKQIGKEWCDHLPGISPLLAEGLALQRMRSGTEPPESGVHEMGEAIGGQMKGEIWGLVCPGRPNLAAEYARRDGVVAHCKNGVYGEQFIAAMISASFTEKNTRKLINIGLSQIPADSTYAQIVKDTIAWHDKYPNWKDTRREVVSKYPNPCNPVYGDAGIVTLALLYGEGDFNKSLQIAASCGSDTDCDTATVGALVGCIIGAKKIPAKWKEPIDNQFRCFVSGMDSWNIPELCKRICAEGNKVLKYHGKSIRFTSGI